MEAIINKQVDEYKTKLFQEEMNRIQKKNNVNKYNWEGDG